MDMVRQMRCVFWGLPAVVLLAAFVAVCLQTGTAWPFGAVVHEDGQRTLLQTIFYFEHAARELPVDLLLAWMAGAAARMFFPLDLSRGARQRRRLFIAFGLGAACVLVLILAGSIFTVGVNGLLDNLAQKHTRPGEPLVWGAHWRFHLLERIAIVHLVFVGVAAEWLFLGRPSRANADAGRTLLLLAAAGFAMLSALFGINGDPFRNPLFLGHQARELLTHTLVTVPLTLGVIQELSRLLAAEGTTQPRRTMWSMVLAVAIAVVCGSYLAGGVLWTNAQQYRQTESVGTAIFPHFFEHTFTYLLVPVWAGMIYLADGREPQETVIVSSGS